MITVDERGISIDDDDEDNEEVSFIGIPVIEVEAGKREETRRVKWFNIAPELNNVVVAVVADPRLMSLLLFLLLLLGFVLFEFVLLEFVSVKFVLVELPLSRNS